MTVQELIDTLKEHPRDARVVLATEDEVVFIGAYDVFDKRVSRHYTNPSKFVSGGVSPEEVVVIA